MALDPVIRYYSDGEEVDETVLNRPLTDIEENLNKIYAVVDGIPTYTADDADKYVKVNSTGTGLEYTEISFGAIRKPWAVTPADEATGVSLTPTLTGSAYAPLYSVDSRDYREFQVDVEGGNFSAPIRSTQLNADSWTVSPDLTTHQAETLIWRIRDVSVSGEISEWSTPFSFTTASAYVKTPSITVEQDGSFAVRAPLLTGSVFDVFGANDGVHASTDWRITRTSDSIVVWSSIADASNLESITVPDQTLDISTQYLFEVRYNSDIYGSSEWGATTLTTVDYYVKTPQLTTNSSGVEGEEHTVTIDNYDSGLTYTISVTSGTTQRSGGTITWTLPMVAQDTSHQISVYATNAYAEQSSTATASVTVLNIPIVADDAVIINTFTVGSYNDGWSV